MYGKRLTALALTTAITLTAGFALAFFYAPMDADQGFMQKIFYVHVPLGDRGALRVRLRRDLAVQHLRTGDRRLRPAQLRGDPPVARSSASAC